MILIHFKPLAALRPRLTLAALATLLLFAHGCHGDDVDHELSVPVPLHHQE